MNGVLTMTFQQLQYILEVHKTGSVSKAAENLFISRSSVSSCISSLESELGCDIFVRTLNGLIPSSKGRQILEYAEKICKTHQLMTNLGETNESRLISIGIQEYAPVIQAATALVAEYKDHRDIRFSFGIYSVNEIIDKLCLFEIEAAVFSRLGNMQLNIEATLESKGLQWKIISTVPTTLVIGNKHPLAGKEDLNLRDLEDDIFLDTLAKEISRNSHIKSLTKIRQERILCTNSKSLRYHILKQGFGYTIGKQPSKHTIEQYDLRCIPIPSLSQPLLFAFNPARPISNETQVFWKMVEEAVSAYND